MTPTSVASATPEPVRAALDMWPVLIGALDLLPSAAWWVFVLVACVPVVLGRRLDDHGATLATALCGAWLGAAWIGVSGPGAVGETWRTLGGAMFGAAGALWLDLIGVRVGLAVAGAVTAGLAAELSGLTGGGAGFSAVVGAATLPFVHAPWPRAVTAGVGSVLLGALRLVPAGLAGVVAVWGLGMALQIVVERRRLSIARPEVPPRGG